MTGLAGLGLASILIALQRRRAAASKAGSLVEGGAPREPGMQYRPFGRTGARVSEVGFGAWAIGGKSYGAVDPGESLDALARAEELGCNFVDTAKVYGDSELTIGRFLRGRRENWIVATKFSRQPEGLSRTLDDQLRRLATDRIDLYQLHWVPGRDDQETYHELYRAKQAGKVRWVGISLASSRQIDHVLDLKSIDAIQVPFNLLQPEPFLDRHARLVESGIAVIVRSALREGFLTGKFTAQSVFADPQDNRSRLSRAEIESRVDAVERFRFLETDSRSLAVAASSYVLGFPATSTVILGTKSVQQAESNFGLAPGGRLKAAELQQVLQIQDELGLRPAVPWLKERLLSLAGRTP